MNLIEVSGISKSYYKLPVLNDKSFSSQPGELLWVSGDNGSGKSTLCKILAGMIAPDTGSIKFRGNDLRKIPPYKRMHDFLSYMPQDSALLYDQTVQQNIDFTTELLGKRKYSWSDAMANLLHGLFNKDEFWGKNIASLSRGERRKLEFFITLMADSAIYLFDEPFSGLDQKSRKIISEIFELMKKENKTLVLIEHDIPSELNSIIDQKVEL
jgi:ABC-type multidrug transport system ATPase subunit